MFIICSAETSNTVDPSLIWGMLDLISMFSVLKCYFFCKKNLLSFLWCTWPVYTATLPIMEVVPTCIVRLAGWTCTLYNGVLSVPGGRPPGGGRACVDGPPLLLLLPNHLETPERNHSQQGSSSDVVLYGVEQVVHLVHVATSQPPLDRANWCA